MKTTALAMLGLGLVACGDGGAAADPAGRAAVVQQVVDLANAGGDLRAGLEGLGEFAAVGVADDGTVWGRFPDGEVLLVADDREPPSEPPAAAPAPVEKSGLFAHPASPKAVVMSAMGRCFPDVATRYDGWLTAAGYDVRAPAPTVDALKALDEASVFYLDTHGGFVPPRDPGPDGGVSDPVRGEAPIFGLWTSTEADAADLQRFAAELKARDLVYMVAKHDRDERGNCTYAAHLGITPAFVKKYVHLAEGSFAFVDACSSDEASIKGAFQEAGAQLYAGWTRTVRADDAERIGGLVFDRMLGAGEAEPQTLPGQPPQVAPNILAELQQRGLNPPRRFFRRRTELRFTHRSEHTPLLVPSLYRVVVQEDQGQLLALGMFPSDGELHLTVGGGELPIVRRDDNLLIARIPPDRTGEVRVRFAMSPTKGIRGRPRHDGDERQSNAVMLSGWRVKLHADRSPCDGSRQALDCDLLFRGDVPFRPLLLTDTPAPPGGDASIELHASTASRCHVVAEGQCGNDTLSVGRADLGPAYVDEDGDDVFDAYDFDATLTIDPYGRTFRVGVEADAKDAVIRTDSDGNAWPVAFELGADGDRVPFAGEGWAVTAGESANPGTGDSLKWEAAAPSPAPGFRTALDTKPR
jgi:hypothetical protein